MRRGSRSTAQTGDWIWARLHGRSDLHLARKIWHMTMGLLIVGLHSGDFFPKHVSILILGLFLALSLFVETARLKFPSLNLHVVRLWGPLMRSHEITRSSTIPYFIAASLVCIGFFPKPVAVLALLYLAVGDPVASMTGVLYGHLGPRFANGKTLVGTLGSVLACLVCSAVYLALGTKLSFDQFVMLTLIGGVVGGVVEHVPLEIDDNFSIPVISGFVVWLAFLVLGVTL